VLSRSYRTMNILEMNNDPNMFVSSDISFVMLVRVSREDYWWSDTLVYMLV
jgi:hypothetical protein